MTWDIDPLVALAHALNTFGVSAAEAAEAFSRMSKIMAELTPAYYALGRVPRLEITTRDNQTIVLADVELDVEVETETLEHRSFGGPVTSVVLNSNIKATIKTDVKTGEELFRLIRED